MSMAGLAPLGVWSPLSECEVVLPKEKTSHIPESSRLETDDLLRRNI